MRRGLWFMAGAGAGVYAMTKARRAAEALTPEGIRDRMAGLSLGAQLLGEDVRAEMAERESQLRQRLRLGDAAELGGGAPRRALPSPQDTETHPRELSREGND